MVLNAERELGFSLLEVLLVIALLGILFAVGPGLDGKSLKKMGSQGEVQQLVDYLRWSQRRAILVGERQYLTLEPDRDAYRFFFLQENHEEIVQEVSLQEVDLIGLNRSVSEIPQTFYFTPNGSPVFGCTITLADQWTEWRIIIGVASGKIRLERG